MKKSLIIPEKGRTHPPILYFPRWVDKGFSLRPKLKNEYHACLYDKDKFDLYGEKAPKVQEAWAYNVFTNLGLDKIRRITWTGSIFDYGRLPHQFMEYCGVGTGTGTPAITDTTFFTFLSYANQATEDEVSTPDSNGINHTIEEYYHRHKFFWDLTEGNGNLTEVGLCYNDSTYNHTITHAMFQDAEGSPITIAKSATKVLVVTATVYLERGTSDSGAVILDDAFDGIINNNNPFHSGWGWGFVWKDSNILGTHRYGYIYLGDTDQTVDKKDCYGTSYPVLGSIRSYKTVASAVASVSGYGVTVYSDWDLGEGNGTWYEVGFRTNFDNSPKNLARIDLPSGAIGGNALVKDDTKKLRVTLEFYYTQ